MHTSNLSTQEAEAVREFKTSIVYIVSSRRARFTENPCLLGEKTKPNQTKTDMVPNMVVHTLITAFGRQQEENFHELRALKRGLDLTTTDLAIHNW